MVNRCEINYKRGLQIFEKEPVRKTLGSLIFFIAKTKVGIMWSWLQKYTVFVPNLMTILDLTNEIFHRKLQSLQNKQLPLISDPSTIRILKSRFRQYRKSGPLSAAYFIHLVIGIFPITLIPITLKVFITRPTFL